MKLTYCLFSPFLILILTQCTKSEYEYLPADTISRFETGDTLIYSSSSTRDTLVINFIERSFEEPEKSTFIEQFIISSAEITDICRNETPFNCYGFHIYRTASVEGAIVYFRNIYDRLSGVSGLISYQLGSKTVDDVYTKTSTEPTSQAEKDVKKIYYTHKYGIIAYELFNGELFGLDEKWIE